MQSGEGKIQKFLRFLRRGKSGSFNHVPDPRKVAIKHPWSRILECLLVGLMRNLRTLRDVEELSVTLYGRKGRISDTSLDQALRTIDDQALQKNLIAQIRSLHRSKRLQQIPGIPLKIVAIDGKNQATLDHDAEGRALRRTSDTAKWFGKSLPAGKPYWITPVLRAVSISMSSTPCLLQQAILPGAGEGTHFSSFVDEIHCHYGQSDLVEVIMSDAGMTSLANANHVNKLGYSYIMGLKENQRMLLKEAERLFSAKREKEPAEYSTPWEKRGHCHIKRHIWRTQDMNGFTTTSGAWSHLRETWLVVQETFDPIENKTTYENRYFITSVNPKRCSSQECINIVREYWGVENDAFNSLDLQWLEDKGIWCTRGNAVWVLGILRMMAYNIAQFIRRKFLTSIDKTNNKTQETTSPWRQTFNAIKKAIEAMAQVAGEGFG